MNAPAERASGEGLPDDGRRADSPDVGFRLAGSEPTSVATVAPEQVSPAASETDPPPSADEEYARELAQSIAHELAAGGPAGWHRVDAVFALAATGGVAHVYYSDSQRRVARFEPSQTVLRMVRAHRELSAGLGDGPWWRMVLQFTAAGEFSVDLDYGEEPFPEGQLLAPHLYAEDLQAFPRKHVPVWLAAYISHGGRQQRSPQLAAARARADRAAGVLPVRSVTDFPPLRPLWARWAVIAAAFVATGSATGPRILPATAVFEGSRNSGATLYLLPGDRAVLSGGVWNAPELDAVYNTGAAMPNYYAGAPEWVADPVLNPRATGGLLSFCYWWDRTGWYRGESPPAMRLAEAVPGLWTAETTADVVCRVAAPDRSPERRSAALALVLAAEAGRVGADLLRRVFGPEGTADIDGALYQLSLAGLAPTVSAAYAAGIDGHE
ncbi:hypothetical protein IU500_26245 [Nocardia terpenica]|uniref:hypothetical protein n=1 Tax=Nocardia terpenica TaxID=455432 RepID=UPI001895C529|nr:hypothetical protein [Nocardia terpenica]MBF6061692.1 hypothetical protein [Nocardia terpenica]MBF6107513.1 hypothetical protein [Nocardia terpenica]MBF6110112.1 hypothetical protein [Nocardia terpenica]MBF6122376.1 hypothetical protein [Nocardia terpenica]MBF6151448.1 hypothetical protein [Nocardia terpenica]